MNDIEKLIKLLEHAESFSLEAYGKSPNLSECSLNIQYLRACILQAISNAKALRERLAQPAQEPVLQDIEQYRMQMASISTAAIGYWKEGDGIHPDYDTPALRDVADLYAKYELLVAQPKQKREWQGLTNEEVGALTVFDGLHHVEIPILANFVWAVEAKIKEKNT